MDPSEESAFPSGDNQSMGMTLRDYFAGQALVALGGHKAVTNRGIAWLVNHAYMVADGMLVARELEPYELGDESLGGR